MHSTRTDEQAVPTHKSSNQAVTLSTAGIRAVIYQLQALYLRTPVKLFRPSRFDYLAYVRELATKHDNLDRKPYSLRTHSSLAMFINVIRKEGWKFIPEKVLPPLLANSATGLILYGTYLTVLDLYESKRVRKLELESASTSGGFLQRKHDEFYFYSPIDTWRAGFIAGAAQSFAAAPVDAIYTRLNAAELLNGKHQNLWVYGAMKLREIGLTGVFAGYSFSLIKESLGFAFYFSTFEIIKTQGYNLTYKLIASYRKFKMSILSTFDMILPQNGKKPEIDPELVKLEKTRLTKILKSTFVLLAGASAAFSLLAVQYPISKIQKIHLARLEMLDNYYASHAANFPSRRKRPFIKLYYNSYIDTYHQILKYKRKSNLTWFNLGYKGFVRNALTAIPATSVGLLVFEIMRTKLSDDLDEPFA